MQKFQKYKIAIIILSVLLFIETVILVCIWTKRPKKVLPAPKPVAVIKGKIAVVLDDWGYTVNNLPILEKIKYPLTLAVLPNLAYSKTIAEDGYKMGLEIILHLPMEPHEELGLEKNTITTDMDQVKIKEILEGNLEAIPYLKGVSNHMGSKATEDIKTMKIIFAELKKRRLYFLDSFVTSKSVCSNLAAKTGLSFRKRDVFLDNENKPEYIKGQIKKLKALAKLHGKAIGVGHDRKVTLEVLKEAMPEAEKEGYKFVFVSDLAR